MILDPRKISAPLMMALALGCAGEPAALDEVPVRGDALKAKAALAPPLEGIRCGTPSPSAAALDKLAETEAAFPLPPLGSPIVFDVNVYFHFITGHLTHEEMRARVRAGSSTYFALPMEYAGTTDAAGVTGTLVSCGLGLPGECPPETANNIALIHRGEISFAEKVVTAAQAGARAVIIYNSLGRGDFEGTLGGPGGWPPAVSVSEENGVKLLALTGATVTVLNHPILDVTGDEATNERILDEIAKLHAVYGPRFRFHVVPNPTDPGRLAYSVTHDEDWFTGGFESDLAMMAALRQGGRQDLNIYSKSLNLRGVLGYSYLPSFAAGTFVDGVVTDSGLWRDAPYALPYGQTLAHEVGHWLGLLHTFEGGCSARNDLVADTPAQQLSFECSVGLDSCPANGFPGLDPNDNVMSYAPAECVSGITDGQLIRVEQQFRRYRCDRACLTAATPP